MDYYQIYLNRLFALGQIDMLLITLEGEETFSLSTPKISAKMERLCKQSRDWFIDRLQSRTPDATPTVLCATHNGLSFCGGQLTLAQGTFYLVLGPFYLKGHAHTQADPTLRVFNDFECVNGFLPFLFEMPYALVVHQETKPEFVPIDETFFENDDDAIVRNDRLEHQICQAIREGDLHRLKRIQTESFFLEPSHYHAGNDIQRRRKNISLALNTLACRAAIEGGVPSVYARSVCAVIAEKIENTTSDAELFKARIQLCEEYCSLVAQKNLNGYSPAVKRCLAYMEQHLAEEINLEQIAKNCKISYAYLSRILKKECGKPYSQLILEMRLKKAKSLLLCQMPIQEAAERTGFKSTSYFCKAFKRQEGLTPTDWCAQHRHT